jgi:hypothetical protein
MRFGESLTDVEMSPYKFIAHIDRLKALSEGRDIFPVTVEIDLVDYCNHSCGWCVDPVHRNNSLDAGIVCQLLSELKELGVKGIVYKGGGEPTLHDSFTTVLEETKRLGFEVGIVTNGSRLQELHGAIVKNADYLRVSIDGPTADSHARLHKSNDFDEVIAGVRYAVMLKKSLGQRHPVIGLSFAMDHQMVDLVGDALILGDSLGVDYILLRPPFYEEVGRPAGMSTEQKTALLCAFERERASYAGKMEVFIDYWLSDSDVNELSSAGESPRRGSYVRPGVNGIEHVTGKCLASPLMAVIAADRKVYACCNLRFLDEWNVGTINYDTGDTFEKLWHGDRRKQVMDRIHQVECIRFCTHPMSRYNEVIEYLRSPRYHEGFV